MTTATLSKTKVKALVLESTKNLSLRDIELEQNPGPNDVKIQIDTVGICGSDVHYYLHGKIGDFIVKEPMVLGHEASGQIVEVGSNVTHLKVGDRVCMEPGIPDASSQASRLGIYNLDPAVRFWATPPIHGCLTPFVVHPAAYTFKLPDSVSYAEGAMVEPFAVGMQAATKAKIKPGDVAVVMGAGPIGMITALAAIASGCSEVIISDLVPEKLKIAQSLGPITAVNLREQNLEEVVRAKTRGWGADIVFEASGSEPAIKSVFKPLCPGGTVVFIGMPAAGVVSVDVVGAQVKEARIENVFRYAHQYPRSLNLMGSGKVNVKPLITDTFAFADSIKAFEYVAQGKPETIKAQITLR
jgi:D-xylulose reductase